MQQDWATVTTFDFTVNDVPIEGFSFLADVYFNKLFSNCKVDILVSRDLDSRMSKREVSAVQVSISSTFYK